MFFFFQKIPRQLMLKRTLCLSKNVLITKVSPSKQVTSKAGATELWTNVVSTPEGRNTLLDGVC